MKDKNIPMQDEGYPIVFFVDDIILQSIFFELYPEGLAYFTTEPKQDFQFASVLLSPTLSVLFFSVQNRTRVLARISYGAGRHTVGHDVTALVSLCKKSFNKAELEGNLRRTAEAICLLGKLKQIDIMVRLSDEPRPGDALLLESISVKPIDNDGVDEEVEVAGPDVLALFSASSISKVDDPLVTYKVSFVRSILSDELEDDFPRLAHFLAGPFAITCGLMQDKNMPPIFPSTLSVQLTFDNGVNITGRE